MLYIDFAKIQIPSKYSRDVKTAGTDLTVFTSRTVFLYRIQ
jgi:hypothetical protein